MVALRASGMRLAAIGRRYGLSRQRVAQIIDQAGRVPVDQVREARRDLQAERALARAEEILEPYRAGLTVPEIARQTGLPVRAVRAAIKRRASDADRAQRRRAQAPPTRAPEYSDAKLAAGLRRVARRLGHAPTSGEYARLAPQPGLASMHTVYQRFGGWRAALHAAGLDVPAPARVYAPQWHIAACWRALCSVADQLGDPPRYRRYQELAAGREDLPSPATVRLRLGLWSQIAAALAARDVGRDGASAVAEGNGAVAVAGRDRAGVRR